MEQEKPTESSKKPEKIELPQVTVSSSDSQEYLPYYLGVTVFIGAIFALGVLVGHYFQETLHLLQEYFYCLAKSLLPIVTTAYVVLMTHTCFRIVHRGMDAKLRH